MSLIDRLKTQRESVEQELQNIEEHAKELAEIAAKAAADKHEKLREIADLAKAIGVLDTHEEERAIERAEPVVAEPIDPFEGSILTGDPAIEPESGLHGEPVVTEIKEPEQPVKPATAEHPDSLFWARAFTRASVDA